MQLSCQQHKNITGEGWTFHVWFLPKTRYEGFGKCYTGSELSLKVY